MQLTQITDVLARLDEAARLNADLQRAYRLKRAEARRPAAQAAQAKFRAESPKAYAKIRAKAALTRKATAMAARDGVTLELLAEACKSCNSRKSNHAHFYA